MGIVPVYTMSMTKTENTVECPKCGVSADERCIDLNRTGVGTGRVLPYRTKKPHRERIIAAKEAQPMPTVTVTIPADLHAKIIAGLVAETEQGNIAALNAVSAAYEVAGYITYNELGYTVEVAR